MGTSRRSSWRCSKARHLSQWVEPEYPRSAFVREIEDRIPVHALVCRSGRVLDAYALPAYRDIGGTELIERDPKLVAAAVAAVRQYLFHPAKASGQPIATWVESMVIFRR